MIRCLARRARRAGVLSASGSRPASAEWFADLFAGLSLTRDHDLKLNDQGIGQGTYESVEFDRSLAWGGRAGRYFDSLPFLGLAVDFFRFYPDIGGQSVQLRGCFFPGGCGTGRGGIGHLDVQTTAISLDLMLRLPLLKSADAPQGPGAAVRGGGPAALHHQRSPRGTRATSATTTATPTTPSGSRRPAGVAVQVFSNLALFGEYRFTHVSPEVELHDANLNRTTLRTDLDTHSALLGISARW